MIFSKVNPNLYHILLLQIRNQQEKNELSTQNMDNALKKLFIPRDRF
jgi:NAD-dependent SIR2 family protein deacetylase